jgi:hypothetical protein
MNHAVASIIESAQRLEFVECDMRHEDWLRHANGELIRPSNFREQCPWAVRINRPSCAHQCIPQAENDVLWNLYAALRSAGAATQSIHDGIDAYQTRKRQLADLDYNIRNARTGSLAGEAPTREEAERDAEPHVLKHRAIVQANRKFRDELVAIAKEKLTSLC